MAMTDAEAMRVIALAFAPQGASEWTRIATREGWHEFIGTLRKLLAGRKLGECRHPLRGHSGTPLQESLAEQEVGALFNPPSPEEMRSFAERHFIGGLPGSAVPVESLYVPWAAPEEAAITHEAGHYRSTRSLYMRDLLMAMGLELADDSDLQPDHLSIELELLACLLEEGLIDEGRQFLIERFGWLSEYRQRLIALGETGRFHLALADAVLGIRTHHVPDGIF